MCCALLCFLSRVCCPKPCNTVVLYHAPMVKIHIVAVQDANVLYFDYYYYSYFGYFSEGYDMLKHCAVFFFLVCVCVCMCSLFSLIQYKLSCIQTHFYIDSMSFTIIYFISTSSISTSINTDTNADTELTHRI